MSFQVTVQPGTLRFRAEPGESLLDEALRAGVPLDFGCNSGSCGECRLRLLAGELQRVRHSDFVIPEAEQGDGWFLACSQSAASDLQIEAPQLPGARHTEVELHKVQVQRYAPLSASICQLRLRMPRRRPLHFLPGQAVELFDGQCLLGRYAIASCPCDGQFVELHLCAAEIQQDEVFSARMFAHGKGLQIRGPLGGFAERDKTDDELPTLFIAWQTGFAALKGLIEQQIANESEQPFHLLWLAADERGLYLENQCRAWADAVDNFSYETHLCHDGGGEDSLGDSRSAIGAVCSTNLAAPSPLPSGASEAMRCLDDFYRRQPQFRRARVYAAVPPPLRERLLNRLGSECIDFPR